MISQRCWPTEWTPKDGVDVNQDRGSDAPICRIPLDKTFYFQRVGIGAHQRGFPCRYVYEPSPKPSGSIPVSNTTVAMARS